jgi:hypothetical protein
MKYHDECQEIKKKERERGGRERESESIGTDMYVFCAFFSFHSNL